MKAIYGAHFYDEPVEIGTLANPDDLSVHIIAFRDSSVANPQWDNIFTCAKSSTVLDLKQMLYLAWKVPVVSQTLFHQGQYLESGVSKKLADCEKLTDCGVQHWLSINRTFVPLDFLLKTFKCHLPASSWPTVNQSEPSVLRM
jgi:hypothetical protein